MIDAIKRLFRRESPAYRPRSPRWREEREAWLHKYPQCAACGTIHDAEVHHVRPVHLYPELECDRSNYMTLCRQHHFAFGHLGNWKAWNPNLESLVIAHWLSVTGMTFDRLDRPRAA